jgi:hypothetical protein
MFRNAVAATAVIGLALSCAAQSGPAARPSTQAAGTASSQVLTDGTSVKLRLGATTVLSNVRVGENLDLEVSEDVRVGDVVVIGKRSIATGEVTGLHGSLGTNLSGRIDISLRSVTLADGEIVPIRSTKNPIDRGGEAMIISSSGQDASIAPGTDVIAYINGNQTVDVTRLRAAGGPTLDVKVVSTPVNAEVSVDGRFNGSTPYVFHLRPGDHTVVVRMAGFQAWQNVVHVTTEPVAVQVTLAREDGAEVVPVSKSTEPSLGDLARAVRSRKPQIRSATETTLEQSGPRDPIEQPAQK